MEAPRGNEWGSESEDCSNGQVQYKLAGMLRAERPLELVLTRNNILATGDPERPMIEIRPAADRFHTQIDWLNSWHSFSFGGHFDPANTGHGLLLVNNDDRVAALVGLRHPRPPRHGDRHLGPRRASSSTVTPRATTASCTRAWPSA